MPDSSRGPSIAAKMQACGDAMCSQRPQSRPARLECKAAHLECGIPSACELSQAEAEEVALPSHSRRFVTCAARWARPSNSFSVDSSLRGAERNSIDGTA